MNMESEFSGKNIWRPCHYGDDEILNLSNYSVNVVYVNVVSFLCVSVSKGRLVESRQGLFSLLLWSICVF